MSDIKNDELTAEQLALAEKYYNMKKDKENEQILENKKNESLSSGVVAHSETITSTEELIFENKEDISEKVKSIQPVIMASLDETPHSKNITNTMYPEKKKNVDMLKPYKEPEKEVTEDNEDIESINVNDVINPVPEDTPLETKTDNNDSETDIKNDKKDILVDDVSDVPFEEIPYISDKEYIPMKFDISHLDGRHASLDYGVFGGKSKYISKKDNNNNKNEPSVVNFINAIKNRAHESAHKRGMFIDYYLPYSNVVFRTYEPSNDIVLSQLKTLLFPDIHTHRSNIDNVSNEEFIDLVLKHTDVLCSDSDSLTDYTIKNKISNSDIEVMKLALGTLMFIIKNDTEEERKGVYTDPSVMFDELGCEKCDNVDSYKINMREALMSVYTEDVINYALKHFSFDKTFDELIATSLRSNGSAANYLDIETKTFYRAIIADPSYDSMKSDFNKMFDYIINKYESYILPDKRTEFYERNNIKDKYYELLAIINDTSEEMAKSIEEDFNGLITYSYVKKITMYNVPDEMLDKGGKISKEDLIILEKEHIINEYTSDVASPSDFLDMMGILSNKFLENIGKAIQACQKNQKTVITVKYDCKKCGHENKGTLDGTSLLGFLIAQNPDS